MALLEGSLDIAGLLLDNGADIDYVDTDSRSSLYIMALENDVKTVEFLLNHGANTELKDCDGRTALHVAAWQGYTDIVQVFRNFIWLKDGLSQDDELGMLLSGMLSIFLPSFYKFQIKIES